MSSNHISQNTNNSGRDKLCWWKTFSVKSQCRSNETSPHLQQSLIWALNPAIEINENSSFWTVFKFMNVPSTWFITVVCLGWTWTLGFTVLGAGLHWALSHWAAAWPSSHVYSKTGFTKLPRAGLQFPVFFQGGAAQPDTYSLLKELALEKQ